MVVENPLVEHKIQRRNIWGPSLTDQWLLVPRVRKFHIDKCHDQEKTRGENVFPQSTLDSRSQSFKKFLPHNGENLMYHFCKLATCYYSYLKSIKGCAFESIPVLWKGLQIFARVEERNARSLWKGSLCQAEQQRTSITSEPDIKTIQYSLKFELLVCQHHPCPTNAE